MDFWFVYTWILRQGLSESPHAATHQNLLAEEATKGSHRKLTNLVCCKWGWSEGPLKRLNFFYFFLDEKVAKNQGYIKLNWKSTVHSAELLNLNFRIQITQNGSLTKALRTSLSEKSWRTTLLIRQETFLNALNVPWFSSSILWGRRGVRCLRQRFKVLCLKFIVQRLKFGICRCESNCILKHFGYKFF